MAYLDISPLMFSLRARPEEFEFRKDWLTHLPSRHSFKFLPKGDVDIRAECNCAFLAIRPEQARQLSDSFQNWHRDYWQPLMINREFASHFKPRSRTRRWIIALTAKLNEWATGNGHAPPHGIAAE